MKSAYKVMSVVIVRIFLGTSAAVQRFTVRTSTLCRASKQATVTVLECSRHLIRNSGVAPRLKRPKCAIHFESIDLECGWHPLLDGDCNGSYTRTQLRSIGFDRMYYRARLCTCCVSIVVTAGKKLGIRHDAISA